MKATFLLSGVFPAFDDKTAPLLTSKQPILRFQASQTHTLHIPQHCTLHSEQPPLLKHLHSYNSNHRHFHVDSSSSSSSSPSCAPRQGSGRRLDPAPSDLSTFGRVNFKWQTKWKPTLIFFRQNPKPRDRCQLRTRSRSTLEIRWKIKRNLRAWLYQMAWINSARLTTLARLSPGSPESPGSPGSPETRWQSWFTFSQIDNPGEVVRITPRKGEVDYQGVHAKARPGLLYQDKDEGSLV